MRTILATLLFAVITVSGAEAKDIVVTVRNDATRTIEGTVAYPVAADGSIIDDAIGGSNDPIKPGRKGTFAIYAGCGRTMVRVVLAGDIEQRHTIDTCRKASLTVRD